MTATGDPRGHKIRAFVAAIAMGCAFLGLAVLVGWRTGRRVATLSLIGTALVLEAQPAVATSVAFHYPLLAGSVVSILGNLAPLPVEALLVHYILHAWPWAARHVQQAERRMARHRRFGPMVLVVLSPFLGAYVALAAGQSLGLNPRRTFWLTLAGMVWSVVAIALGGHWVAHFIIRV